MIFLLAAAQWPLEASPEAEDAGKFADAPAPGWEQPFWLHILDMDSAEQPQEAAIGATWR